MNKVSISTLALLVLVLGGCAQKRTTGDSTTPLPDYPQIQNADAPMATTELQARAVQKDIYQQDFAPNTEVIRDGRYTLVTIAPEDGQKFLLEQVVNVKVPRKKTYSATVEQGLRSTLKNTGLDLCYAFADHNVRTLFSRPLPKVHYAFGPMKLYEALQMIAGPAFELTLNDISRTVCFKTRLAPVAQQAKPLEVITTTTTTEVIEEE